MHLGLARSPGMEATDLSDPRDAAPAQRSVRLVGPTLAQLWLAAPLVVVFAYAANVPIFPNDLFWSLASGKVMFEVGPWPWREALTYAPRNEPTINQPWLAHLAFHATFDIGGYPLLLLLHGGAITISFALIAAACWNALKHPRIVAFLTVGAFLLAATNLNVRTQTFGVLCFALFLAALRAGYDEPRWLLALPLIMAGWVNVHGSFVLGLALLVVEWGAAALSRALPLKGQIDAPNPLPLRRLAMTTALVIAATLANPVGPLILRYVTQVVGSSVIQRFTFEWQPPNLLHEGDYLFWASLVIVAVVLALRRERASWREVLLAAVFIALGLRARRNIIWWGLVMAPILATVLRDLRPPRQLLGRHAMGSVVAAFFALVALLSLPWARLVLPLRFDGHGPFLDANTPVAATDFLATHLEGQRIFTNMEWGGYVAWVLWPRARVFVDARLETYTVEAWEDYLRIMDGAPAWEQLLEQYRPDYLLIDQDNVRLVEQVRASPRWRLLYEDDVGVVFQRDAAPREARGASLP